MNVEISENENIVIFRSNVGEEIREFTDKVHIGLRGLYSCRQKTGEMPSITKAKGSKDETGPMEIMEHLRAFL